MKMAKLRFGFIILAVLAMVKVVVAIWYMALGGAEGYILASISWLEVVAWFLIAMLYEEYER